MLRQTIVLRAAMGAIMVLAVGVPVLVARHPPAIPRQPPRVRIAPTRVVPQAELPAVEPLKFVDMTAEEAEAYNASIPFSTLPNPAARPFKLAGTPDDLARATDCLAAGVLYEAGDDAAGEKAVAQVMLNRLRHPAFPKTVCAVVFEGAERSTGCQFSFTCDHALDRWHPTEEQWTRARAIAAAALAGAVYRPVGYSTHYHTDWVVPYWQSSLDKVAAVHSHLFFRWTGWWGTPGAFRRQVQTGEPVIAQLAAISPAHGMASLVLNADGTLTLPGMTPDEPADTDAARPLAPLATDPDTFLTTLDPRQPADSYEQQALAACGERVRCRVLGWADPAAAAGAVPLTAPQIAALSFSYVRDRGYRFERILWDCGRFKRTDTAQCIKPTQQPSEPAKPDPLEGVRRRTDLPTPATKEAPTAAKQPAPAIKPPGTSPEAAP